MPGPLKILAPLALMLALAAACSPAEGPGLKDGYYTAEASGFDSLGWKRFMTIYVNQDRIVTVEYNAKNASGFLRSWDMDSMRRMNAEAGTYPSKYARAYAVALINRQNPAQVEAVPGADRYLESFRLLAEAAIDRARRGDRSVAFVDLPDAALNGPRPDGPGPDGLIQPDKLRIDEASLHDPAADKPVSAGPPPPEP